MNALEGSLDVALVPACGFVVGALELCVADVEGAEFAPVFGRRFPVFGHGEVLVLVLVLS